MGNTAGKISFAMSETLKIGRTRKTFKAMNVKLSRSEFIVRFYVFSIFMLYYSKYKIHTMENEVFNNYQKTILFNNEKSSTNIEKVFN